LAVSTLISGGGEGEGLTDLAGLVAVGDANRYVERLAAGVALADPDRLAGTEHSGQAAAAAAAAARCVLLDSK